MREMFLTAIITVIFFTVFVQVRGPPQTFAFEIYYLMYFSACAGFLPLPQNMQMRKIGALSHSSSVYFTPESCIISILKGLKHAEITYQNNGSSLCKERKTFWLYS